MTHSRHTLSVRSVVVSAAFLLGVFSAPLARADEPQPAGKHQIRVMAIVRAAEPIERVQTLLAQPEVDGVVYYTSLIRVRPEPDRFDFTPVEQVLNACQAAGKKMKLAILGGRWVPEWFYQRGVQKFEWVLKEEYVDAGTRKASAPVPWDLEYLRLMKETLQQAGQKFRDRPELIEVQVTGPALANGLETNFSLTAAQAESIGYTPEKLTAAWEQMIDAAGASFEKQNISLALHDSIVQSRSAVMARQLREYGFARLGKRFVPLVCYLTHEDWFARGNQAVDIWAEAGENHRMELAAQLIDIYSVKHIPPEKVAIAVKKARALGAVSLEVFSADLLVPEYRQSIDAASK